MLKEVFHDSFEISKLQGFVRKPCKRDWVAKVVFLIQMLPTFGSRCNRSFWDIRLKILRLPIFNVLFQLVITKCFKRELSLCLPKVDQVIKSCKEPPPPRRHYKQMNKPVITQWVPLSCRTWGLTITTEVIYIDPCSFICMSSRVNLVYAC